MHHTDIDYTTPDPTPEDYPWLITTDYTLVNGPYANQKLQLPESAYQASLFVTIGKHAGRYVSNYDAYTGKLIPNTLIWVPRHHE